MSNRNKSDSDPASPEQSGGSPGTILRRCREYHGITLEEASETTKIGLSHLKALEDDRIREFANQAYLKGFLRIYATYLGLNSEDVARMYEKLFGVKDEQSPPPFSSSNAARPRLLSLKKMVFPAVLLAVILITATFYKQSSPPVRKPQPTAETAPAPLPNAVQAVRSSARDSRVVREMPEPRETKHSAEPSDTEKTVEVKKQADTVKGFVLKIKVTQNGTLTATVDGSGPQQYELTVGDVIEWKAEKKVTLDLSNAGGVDVEMNGKPYKSLGGSGKPVYVELDSDGVMQ